MNLEGAPRGMVKDGDGLVEESIDRAWCKDVW
jgi:hypothetical protein